MFASIYLYMNIYCYLCTILILVTMNKKLSNYQLLRPMVWQSETTQCDVTTHRTPNGRTFINSYNSYNYVSFRLARCIVQH